MDTPLYTTRLTHRYGLAVPGIAVTLEMKVSGSPRVAVARTATRVAQFETSLRAAGI